LDWFGEVASARKDSASALSVDSFGNVYLSGSSYGNLQGSNAGNDDAFVGKFNSVGQLLWTRQFGTSGVDYGSGVAADGLGNVLVTGGTSADLDGPNAGNYDAFLRKYDADGNLLWAQQFGTLSADRATAAAADRHGNIYVSGITQQSDVFPFPNDAWLSKFDTDGKLLWSRQQATPDSDTATSVFIDQVGNVYLAGDTTGVLDSKNAGSYDAFLSKYDVEGNHFWTRQHGGPQAEFVRGVSADALGNVFVTGSTQGGLTGSTVASYDAFVLKYDAAGNLLWSRQPGTAGYDESHAVAADRSGNVYLAGATTGSFQGLNAGSDDVFMMRIDLSGNLVWSHQFGGTGDDIGFDLSKDSLGNVFVAGLLNGLGRNNNFGDAFLAKFDEVPETTSVGLSLAGVLMTFTGWAGRRPPMNKFRP
jgi:hypothetical protein